ncbi:unnamed protein product [Cunninghamella blakesleeana]
MIQIPFNLAKRAKFRQSLKNNQSSENSKEEKFVTLAALDSDQEPRLKIILTLCYNLLRVFLLGVSSYEESHDHKTNQTYVVDTSGDIGIQLYLQHLNSGIGASTMLEKLIQNNSSLVQKIINAKPDIVENLVKATVQKTNMVLQYLTSNYIENETQSESSTIKSSNSSMMDSNRSNSNSSGRIDHLEFNGCLLLLSAFCINDSSSGSLIFSHRDYVLEQIFDLSNQGIQLFKSRINDDGLVEINLLMDDCWFDLSNMLKKQPIAITLFFANLLNLFHSLTFDTNNAKSLQTIQKYISKDVCLKCLGDVDLPNEIRAKFCDLLNVLYINVAPYFEVLLTDYTLKYDMLEGSSTYPQGGTGSADSKCPEFFDQLKRWILIFLDDHHHIYTENYNDVEFLSSVLKLIYTQLKLGFFSDAEDMKRLFRALVYVLDGRADARNEDHLKYLQNDDKQWTERFLLTEVNRNVMNVKIQILQIYELIFNLRIHVRLNKLATTWKKMETNADIDPFMSLSNILTTIFDETILRQRESGLMPILKDILKYQYGPLKRIAVAVMHRVYHDCEDLFKVSDDVLILHDAQQVFVYHGIKKRLARLRSHLLVEKLGFSHLPLLNRVLNEFLSLFQGYTIDHEDTVCLFEFDTDTTTDVKIQQNIYNKIFKNLDAHKVIIHILKTINNDISYTIDSSQENAYVEVIKTCLELLVILIRDDSGLQGPFVLENFDLLLDISKYHSSLSSILYNICGQNVYISLRINEEQIKHVLEHSSGFEPNYLHLLQDFMKPQGKLIKRNQDIIMRLVMDNRQLYVPFTTVEELLQCDKMDYCLELIELLSICGHGENSFGQSFARTVFTIEDITNMVQNIDTPYSLKTKALRFLASIYLDTADIQTSIISIDENSFINILIETLYQDLIDANNASDEDVEDDFNNYIYDGVLVFMRSIFEYHIRPEMELDDHLYDLCPRIVDTVTNLLPPLTKITSQHQYLLACLDSMINVSGFHGKADVNLLRRQLRSVLTRLNDSNKITNRQLGSINSKFLGFMRTLKAHRSILELQEEEFERLGSHYNLSGSESEQDVKSLIDFLSMMTSNKHYEKDESYQIATMKLLEEIPTRYIRKRSESDVLNNPTLYEELEDEKTKAQNTLNRLGCTLVAQNFLSSPRRHIFKAALTLLIALLEGGNKNVQDELEKYFYSIREERFFYSYHRRFQSDISTLKETHQHLLHTAIKWNRQQSLLYSLSSDNASQQAHIVRNQKRTSIIGSSLLSLSNKDPLSLTKRNGAGDSNSQNKRRGVNGSKFTTFATYANIDFTNNQTISTLMTRESTEFGVATEDYEVMKDSMRALQLMVEGHNITLQRYLVKQPDNIKSFNIVQDVVEYLHAIVPLCNIQNIRLIIQVLDTITDLAQGCLENQLAIFNGKIINPVNIILRESYSHCPSSLVNELKNKVVICLLSLLEGGIDKSETIFREMAGSLDLKTVIINMDKVFNTYRGQLSSPNTFPKLEGGFLYCMLIMTLYPALDDAQLATIDGNNAYEYFQRHTGKIEVVMEIDQEKHLSRVLFPIPEICKYLREETKQRFLWNVKRDSPSTKIEDFVEQSNHMIYEIENQARVTYNEQLSLLTKYSSIWWKASFLVTLTLNGLMLGCSSMLHTEKSSCSYMSIFFRLLLGFIHLILWHLSTAEFYFIQLPVLVKRQSSTKFSLRNSIKEDSSSFLKSFFLKEHFDVDFVIASLMEPQFIYHIVMVLLSYLGLFYPAFYAIHILDFVFRDRIIQGVISSITLNGSSISHTALLAIVVIYLHSVVAYKYFRSEFDESKGLYCRTLSECFINVLSHGLRGGIGDVFGESADLDEEYRGWRIGFEMSFYLVVVVFLLNAIFGIIFDTFGHLRDERSAVQQDMKNSCFICSIPAVDFQRHAKRGFEDHVKNDHNIWQYLFFLVHLKYKDRTEYTGPESYVAECLKDANYGFFPINRALSHQNESNDSERLENLEDMAQLLMEKLAKMEDQIEKINDMQSRSRSNSILLSPY